MSKIKMQIANGYLLGPVKKAVEDNSMVSPVDAVTDWLAAKYGGWIERTMGTTDYIIGDVVYWYKDERDFGGSFSITFDSPTHEDYFVKNVGGKIVPMEASE